MGTSQVGFPPLEADDRVKCAEGEADGAATLEFTLDGRAGPGTDFARLIGSPESHHNLIQLWGIEYPHEETGSGSGVEVRLRYLVELSGRGSCWGLCWSGTDVRLQSNAAEEADRGKVTRFGLLAAVCGDGSCLVFLLPKTAIEEEGSSAERYCFCVHYCPDIPANGLFLPTSLWLAVPLC